jgi:penicillin-binding protein 2
VQRHEPGDERGGSTAFNWRITQPGFEMAGKTGTARSRLFSGTCARHHQEQRLDWKLRDHAVIGYAPVDNPKYAIVSIIEHGATCPPHVATARCASVVPTARSPECRRLPGDRSASAAPPRAGQAEPPQPIKAGG